MLNPRIAGETAHLYTVVEIATPIAVGKHKAIRFGVPQHLAVPSHIFGIGTLCLRSDFRKAFHELRRELSRQGSASGVK